MSSKVKFQDQYSKSGESTPKLAASPIDIPNNTNGGGERRRASRRRRDSSASSLSSLSADSPATPGNGPAEEDTSPVDVATSPILSYFLSHASPIKSAHRTSFRNRRKSLSNASAVVEDDDEDEAELPHVLHHSRRLSHSWQNSGTIGIPQRGPITDSQQERHNSLMRRLSIGAAFNLPMRSPPAQQNTNANGNPLSRVMSQPTPNHTPPVLTAPPQEYEFRTPTPQAPKPRAAHPTRAATISAGSKHRPPSPMGERMLKGDFHGF